METRIRQKWTLTQDAFDKLLLSFGDDRDSGGKKYLEIRNNLTRFFDGAPALTPKITLTKQSTALPSASPKANKSEPRGLRDGRRAPPRAGDRQRPPARAGRAERDHHHDDRGRYRDERRRRPNRILRQSLASLSADNRQLIVEYYEGEKGDKIKNRKKLVDKLGIPVNTLRMRAFTSPRPAASVRGRLPDQGLNKKFVSGVIESRFTA